MIMVEDAFYNITFIVDIILSENDRTIGAVLKHPLIGVQGQVLKTSKGKLMRKSQSHHFLQMIPPIA